MTRTTQTNKIKRILDGTPFRVKQRKGQYIFERTEKDEKFIPDFQILPNFEGAVRWARSIKDIYEEEHH